jgi:2-isopropylmalate synthase
MEYKLKMSPDEVVASVAHHVAYAKKYCSDIEFSAEDSTRSDLDFLCRVFETAIQAGATTLNIPDTVGYMVPDEYARRIIYLREHTKGIENVVLSCHVHNDLGMAVAISLAGVQAGVDQIECTINGIGERAGNASMEECVMALNTRRDIFGIDCKIDTKQIYRASRMIQTITGVAVAPTKPIVGANAFAHEAGIHQHGVLANKQTYEIMTPESVGIPKNSIVLGKHSGRHAFEDRLQELGYTLDKEALNTAFEKFKVLADKKKTIKNRDLEAIIMGSAPTDGAEDYVLDSFVINSGNSITSTAVIRLKKGDTTMERVAANNGPVEAAYRAINKIVGKDIALKDYSLKAITDGEDSQAEAIVKISVEDGELVTGRGVSTDIVEASIKAYINGINKYFND